MAIAFPRPGPLPPSPLALARELRRAPLSPAGLAAFLAGHEAELAFRGVVRQLFPVPVAAAILDAREPGADRQTAQVWAFCQRVEQTYFPIYEVEEYEQLLCGIPFLRLGWSYDDFHELDRRPGMLLLMALCAQPFGEGLDSRVSVLDAVEQLGISRDVLDEIPRTGLTPAELHARFDGTPLVGAADFADWTWGQTATAFLDFDDETEVGDADWTLEIVQDLAEQWGRARSLMERIDQLQTWLEADPAAHFEDLLAAALGEPSRLDYERERRLYACEITHQGLVPTPDDEPDPLALPSRAAA